MKNPELYNNPEFIKLFNEFLESPEVKAIKNKNQFSEIIEYLEKFNYKQVSGTTEPEVVVFTKSNDDNSEYLMIKIQFDQDSYIAECLNIKREDEYQHIFNCAKSNLNKNEVIDFINHVETL